MEHCDVCGQDASHTCGNCHQVAYCSEKCQAQDWLEHCELDCTPNEYSEYAPTPIGKKTAAEKARKRRKRNKKRKKRRAIMGGAGGAAAGTVLFGPGAGTVLGAGGGAAAGALSAGKDKKK